MLIEIYLVIIAFAVTFSVLAFYFRENLVYSWFSSFLWFILSLSSAKVEYQSCSFGTDYINNTIANISNYTKAWNCVVHPVEQVPLIYLFMGLGILMFVFAIFTTIKRIPKLLR